MIKLIVLDVDGCLSDGKITYTGSGDEIKSFNVKDGLAIKSWQKLGFDVAIITGRKSSIVTRRAKELGVDLLFQGVKNKLNMLNIILEDKSYNLKNVAAIGDDLNDIIMLKQVAISFTPNDGALDIIKIADIVLKKNGGDGVVREMIEYLIDKQNLRKEFLALWE